MFIDEEKKFIFFHNPKCGGTTLQYLLSQSATLENTKKFLERNNVPVSFEYNILSLDFNVDCIHDLQPSTMWKDRIWIWHIPVSILLRDYSLNHVNEYWKFCFIRNPYTLFYSMFQQSVTSQTQCYLQAGLLSDFNIFVKGLTKATYFFINSDYTHYQGQKVMDFIGRYETYAQDVEKVCRMIGLPYDANVHANKRGKEGENYLNYYTSNSIRVVNELYAKDFELFGYEMLDPKDFPDELPSAKKE